MAKLKNYLFMKKLVVFWLNLVLIFQGFSQQRLHPRLIVGIVVEQMRYDFLYRYWDKFSENGFKRLVKHGIVFHNASYDYLNPNSVASLASLATGAHPNVHGIIAPQWYDRVNKVVVDCALDPETYVLGKKQLEYGGSPKKVLAQSFSDQLSLSTFGASKIVVIAPTMQQAVVSGGQLADEVYWFDMQTGKWVSSSYYFKSSQQLPPWVRTFNRRNFPKIYLKNVWQTSLPIQLYSESLPDQSLGEKGLGGQSTFPYDLSKLKSKVDNKYWLFMHTPFFNTFVKDFAISSIVYDGVGKDAVTDYLFVVFPATAYISQVFGIRSVEVEDAYIKLDKDIAHFLQALDDIVGRDNYILFLTSDRGACDNASLLRNMGLDVKYFNPYGTKLVLDAYLRGIYGMADLVDTVLGNQIYLNQKIIDRQRIDPWQIQRNAADFYSQFKAVQTAFAAQTFYKNSFNSGLLYLAYNSFNPKRSGDIIFTLAPNSFIERKDKTLLSFSDCYCTCNNQTQLPLIFFSNKFRHAHVYKHVDITGVAPTLSILINLQLPENSTDKILLEVLTNLH